MATVYEQMKYRGHKIRAAADDRRGPWFATVRSGPCVYSGSALTVLGSYPTADAAMEMAKAMVDGLSDRERVCNPRDIDRVRRENRERARA